MKKLFLTFTVLLIFTTPKKAESVRLKDLASVYGVRPNQLIGYGLVVGLTGTGDDKQISFTIQSVAAMLSRMGLRVDPSRLTIKNVAAVTVTATLPAFVRTGTRINVRVSSIGNAKSLKGGILLATPLKGFDNKVYMVAQGPVVIGKSPGRRSRGANITTGTVIGGGLVEKEVPVHLGSRGEISLSLKNPDFTTASRISNRINRYFGRRIALAKTSGNVEILVPQLYRTTGIVRFISMIENLEVIPDTKAKIVINQKTGTVVIGPGVSISTCAISHAGISLTIGQGQSGGNAKTSGVAILGGSTLGDVVDALNAIGVSPSDLTSIFRMLKKAGALHGELEVQ